jgi:hypothetical protein
MRRPAAAAGEVGSGGGGTDAVAAAQVRDAGIE